MPFLVPLKYDSHVKQELVDHELPLFAVGMIMTHRKVLYNVL